MYKNLSIAVLLVAFGLVAARSTGTTPASTPTSPTIVASVSLPNQTAPIPSTVLFTPSATGLFRVTAYMTEVVPFTSNGSYYTWIYHLGWTDDAGKESGNGRNGIMVLQTQQTPPSAWAATSSTFSPGLTSIVEAVGGAPITFSISKGAGTVNGPSTYSLYVTVEQLI
jgi:hypothetical protein